MKHTLTVAMLLCCLLSMISCKTEKATNTFDESIHKLYGEYILSDIHWHGLPVNLDNDNTGNWELLYEFQHKLGYFEPDYTAYVAEGMVFDEGKSWAKATTAFNVTIPYPHYIHCNGMWTCTGIRSINVTLRATEDNFCLGKNCCYLSIRYDDKDDVFLANIQDFSLVVNTYDDSVFKVGVHCSFPYNEQDGTQILNENFLYYTFSKRTML